MIDLVGESEIELIGAYSPDQARDEHGQWTDGAAHYTGPGGHFSVSHDPSTNAHEVRKHEATGVKVVDTYWGDHVRAHRHAQTAARGLRVAVRLVGAEDLPSRRRMSTFAADHAAELVKAPKATRDAIRNEVRKALKNGEGPDGIATRLFGEIDMTPEEIDRIAQTEFVIARTGARLVEFEKEAGDDLDARKMWTLGAGEEGCPTCAFLAGQEVPLDDQFEGPDGELYDGSPAHPNCKCDLELVEAQSVQRAALHLVGAASFGCVIIRPPSVVANIAERMAARIPEDALTFKGRETDPHVTVRWGFTDNDPDGPSDLLAAQGRPLIQFGKTSVFDGPDYDVVKVDVVSEDLIAMNRRLGDLPNEPTFEYQPHMTLAYVKSGLGSLYAGMDDLDGKGFTAATAVFSDAENTKTELPIGSDDVQLVGAFT